MGNERPEPVVCAPKQFVIPPEPVVWTPELVVWTPEPVVSAPECVYWDNPVLHITAGNSQGEEVAQAALGIATGGTLVQKISLVNSFMTRLKSFIHDKSRLYPF